MSIEIRDNVGDIHTLKSARVVQLIETDALAGNGTDADPYRRVIQYWTFDGILKASFDQWEQEQKITQFMQAHHQ